MEKMTNKKALEVAIEKLNAEKEMAEVVAKLQNMLNSLNNKKPTAKRESKVAEANLENAKLVVEKLKGNNAMTTTEIIKMMGWMETVTTSKMTAILSAGISAGLMDKVIEKGKSKYFVIAE